jgi:hypothetical protein
VCACINIVYRGRYLTALEGDASNAVSDARLGEIATFVSEELGTTPPPKLVGAPRAQRVAYLLEKVRRCVACCHQLSLRARARVCVCVSAASSVARMWHGARGW